MIDRVLLRRYFQNPPCSLHCEPVLLHLLHVSLPARPLARPPLHELHSWTGRKHFLH